MSQLAPADISAIISDVPVLFPTLTKIRGGCDPGSSPETVTLIIMRHGQSIWNAENRFTGWMDIPLTTTGERDAQAAGQQLLEHGLTVDVAFTSVLQVRRFPPIWPRFFATNPLEP
jgi:hypothetical protein